MYKLICSFGQVKSFFGQVHYGHSFVPRQVENFTISTPLNSLNGNSLHAGYFVCIFVYLFEGCIFFFFFFLGGGGGGGRGSGFQKYNESVKQFGSRS